MEEKYYDDSARKRIDAVVRRVESNPELGISVPGGRGPRGGKASHWGKTDAQVTQGNSVAVSVWKDDPLADSGENITATLGPIFTTLTIPSGDWVFLQKVDGRWFITDCQQYELAFDVVTSTGNDTVGTKHVHFLVTDDGNGTYTPPPDGADFTEITVLTDFQVSGLTLQTKNRTAKVKDPGTESGWTTDHTGTNTCPT